MEERVNAQLILDYIKDNNLTKKEFCQRCKVNVSTFYSFINGKNFNMTNLLRMAKTMNVPLHKFFENDAK